MSAKLRSCKNIRTHQGASLLPNSSPPKSWPHKHLRRTCAILLLEEQTKPRPKQAESWHQHVL